MIVRLPRLAFIALAFLAAVPIVEAQLATGSYPFGTYSTTGPDVINIGNLNVLWDIPVLSKPGRGLPLTYNLAYNSLIWTQATSGSTTSWQPVSGWGWSGLSQAGQSEITYTVQYSPSSCIAQNRRSYPVQVWTYSNIQYLDKVGVQHPFPGTITFTQTSAPNDGSGLCPITGANPQFGFTAIASDGSGYTAVVNALIGTKGLRVNLTNAKGLAISAPIVSNPSGQQGTWSEVDTNGNELTLTNGQYTDTTGAVALSILGTAPSNTLLSYTTTSGTNASYIVSYKSYTVQTAFGCTGISDYPATSNYLVDRVTLPDNSFYQFQYEPTPGAPANVTARVASVTLPTGGTINYTYTGGNNGIVCADGSTAGITRTTPATADAPAANWTYTRTPGAGTSVTNVTDGLQNNSVYTFVEPNSPTALAQYYETQRNIYQGAATGTPVLARQTCYNVQSNSCPTSPYLFLPISWVSTFEVMDGLTEHGTYSTFNAYGQQTSLEQYDFGGSSTRGPLLQSQSWAYANTGLPLLSRTSTYDGSSNQINTASYYYDQTALTPKSSLPNSVSVTGQRGNLTSVVTSGPGSSSATTAYAYDTAGQVVSSTDPAGNITTYTYDAATDVNLTGSSQQVGTLSIGNTYSYFGNTGLLQTASDPNSNPTTYSYDTSLRASSALYPDTGSASATYNVAANNATIAQSVLHNSGASISAVTTLDPYGRPQQVSLADSAGNDLVSYTYDANGNLHTVSNPYRTTGDSTYGLTTYTYDVLGRLTKTVAPDGTSTTTTIYLANTALTTDPANHQREIITDGIGRISQVLEPDSSNNLTLATTYAYLQNFNSSTLTTQTIVQQKGGSTQSSQWRTRTFTSDMLGRLVQSSVPESGTTTYTYSGFGNPNCAGNLTLPCTRTDALGTTTTYTYDALSRPTGRSYSDTTAPVTYTYDQSSANGLTIQNGKGNRTSMSDGSGTSAWSYDAMGRIATIKRTFGGLTGYESWSYNLDGTTNSFTDYAGNRVNYGYDTTGKLTSVTDAATGIAYLGSGQYAPPGALTSATLGNGVALLNQYNSLLQPAALTASRSGTQLFGLTFGYGTAGHNNGNITSITNSLAPSRSASFGYDQLNRLQTAQAGTLWGYTYAYDNWGNLQSMTPASGITNSETALTTIANASNQLPVNSYDADGRVTTDNIGNNYTYDAEGRIHTVNGYTYTYDGDGNRVEKQSGSSGRLYGLDLNGNAAVEVNLAGTSIVRNIFVNGTQLARQDTSGNWWYFLHDQLGTPKMVLSATGTVASDTDFYPFGGTAYSAGSSTNLYGFTGYEADTESSSNYAVFRNQSPSTGRFNRPDPYDGSYDFTNPQSLNRYSYALNNPIRWTDPFGLTICDFGANADGTEQYDNYDNADDCIADGGTVYNGDGGSVSVTTDPPGDVDLGGDLGGGVEGFAAIARPPQRTPQQCQALANKINNVLNDIASSQMDLNTNPLNLPLTAPGRLANSVYGHQQLLGNKIKVLANLAHEYNSGCGGGPPTTPTNGAPAPSPSPILIPPVFLPMIGAGEGAVVGTAEGASLGEILAGLLGLLAL